ncbi:MAG: hypothetical protein EHM80_00910 [Nitrospiraceae bacterium]|nr:MAG: hypothetical protein EHM80_00910 [Nitrospiraceae bacterium]
MAGLAVQTIQHSSFNIEYSPATPHPDRGGPNWLDSLFSSLSGASRVADYAAVSRAGRLS